MKVPDKILKIRRALSLDLKVAMSQARIRDWYLHWHGDVYISFSGGKDSTVLLDIVRKMLGYHDIPAVFCDTGVEFPEIRKFVKTIPNVVTIKPTMRFQEVLEKHGYPIVSKRVCQYAREARPTDKNQATVRLRRTGIKSDGRYSPYSKLSNKWHKLIDAPFQVSERCCDVLKKRPFYKYEKSTGRKPITGMMASESQNRELMYMKHGCNLFDTRHPMSNPLSFWTEQDILKYILDYQLEISKVYGEVVLNGQGQLKTTGQKRTGCVFCGFGAHMRDPNQYQLLYHSHPKLWDHCINKLGFKRVLDFAGIKYLPDAPGLFE